MIESISHSFADESIDAKAKWFKALSIEERMKIPKTASGREVDLEDVRILTSEEKESDSEDRSA
jgi:hypothetical protein